MAIVGCFRRVRQHWPARRNGPERLTPTAIGAGYGASGAGASAIARYTLRLNGSPTLAFVRRRISGACYRTLIATAVPETAFETLCGAALVAWMVARGLLSVPHVLPALLAVPPAGVCVALALRVSGRRETMPLGFAIFSAPMRFLAQVASWQALARVIRLGLLVCFLAAFGLPRHWAPHCSSWRLRVAAASFRSDP
jgi:hypothetical protein